MPSLTEKEVRKILSNKLRHEEFTIDKFNLNRITAGNGMMGEHLKLTVQITNNNKKANGPEVHSFFVKMKLATDDFNDMPEKVFTKESATYSAFRTMNIPLIDESLAVCYYADEVHLVFADLAADGYDIQSKTPASLPEMLVILKTLAAIHAGGIIYEERQREKTGRKCALDKEFPEAFGELYMIRGTSQDHLVMTYYTAFIRGLETAIDMLQLPQTLKNGESFKEELESFWNLFDPQPSIKFRNAICQCDLFAANIFMLKDAQGEPLHAKIIDYQITRYQPPALDVLDAILLNTTREFRQTHMLTMVRSYFNDFCENFKKSNVDPASIYTYEEFLASCNEVEFFAILMECITLPIVAIETETFADILDSENKNEFLLKDRSPLIRKFKDNAYYMSRVKDTLLDLLDNFNNEHLIK